jgi:hypothetical protein
LSSGITANGASISWSTNEPSNTQVEYGATTAYGSSTTLNTAMVTAHSASLSGLSANTLYHYRVKSRDAAGNLATSADFTFTTSSTTTGCPGFTIEGFGRNATGGCGGSVIMVTNLNDAGPGSFRDAVTRPGRRIVKFQVSGTIFLQTDVRIYNGDLTIDGSDAPNQGVAIGGDGVGFYANNVIVRHMRFRMGAIASSPESADAVRVGSDNGSVANNVVLDHCSISWAIDENISVVGGARNVTIQHCIISEALAAASHPEGNHSYGLLGGAGGPSESLTVHHTLFVSNNGRNPEIIDGDYDFVNNVVYNPGLATASFQAPWEGPMRVNWVGNYYRRGPASHCSSQSCRAIRLNDRQFTPQSTAYFSQNIDTTERPNYSVPERNMYYHDTESNPAQQVTVLTNRIDFGYPAIAATDAFVARDFVLANAGATLPCRDAVDRRVVNLFFTGTGSILNTEADVGGWPNLNQPCGP